MPATIVTEEQFPSGVTREQIEVAVQLRLKASAISSQFTGSEIEGWVLKTTWNVIGEQ